MNDGFISMYFSQSYDIGKMSVKYAPKSDLKVGCAVHSLVIDMLYSDVCQLEITVVLTVFNCPHIRQRFYDFSPLFISIGTVRGFTRRLLMLSA